MTFKQGGSEEASDVFYTDHFRDCQTIAWITMALLKSDIPWKYFQKPLLFETLLERRDQKQTKIVPMVDRIDLWPPTIDTDASNPIKQSGMG